MRAKNVPGTVADIQERHSSVGTFVLMKGLLVIMKLETLIA